ncbi:MAG: hypothetical protein EXR57_02810 [Dehalococcoidia bacterium]|nr:hypothetical protein [Dehalococcoidia bacterium]
MSAIAKLWNAIFFHRGNGWFDLPRTHQTEALPPHEGPFGPMKAKTASWLSRITYGGRHATPGFYVAVAIILTILTLVEVWLFTVTSLGALFVPLLLFLSVVKFVMVIGFFMHLRFDPKGFTYIFAAGMGLGVTVFLVLLTLFSKLSG